MEIFGGNRKQRQHLLFSATLQGCFEDLNWVKEPYIHIEGGSVQFFFHLKLQQSTPISIRFAPVDLIEQYYLFVPEKVKPTYLTYLLRVEEAKAEKAAEDDDRLYIKPNIIIFCSTCSETQLVHETLQELSLPSASLHSEISQKFRLQSLEDFRNGKLKVLVTTDVCSRGLDIPSVELVINYDVPSVPEDYIHRVGRTGRAQRSGRAITIVTQYEIHRILNVEKSIRACFFFFFLNLFLNLEQIKKLLNMK
jgi:superfamily II DNA/RNA helicase